MDDREFERLLDEWFKRGYEAGARSERERCARLIDAYRQSQKGEADEKQSGCLLHPEGKGKEGEKSKEKDKRKAEVYRAFDR